MRDYRIPEIYIPIDKFVGPEDAIPMEDHIWNWIREVGLADAVEREDYLVSARPRYLASCYFPDADPEHVWLVTKFMVAAFVVDRLDDLIQDGDPEGTQSICADISAAMLGKREPGTGLERALRETLAEFCEERSTDWCNCLIEENERWLATYSAESRWLRSENSLPFYRYVPHRGVGYDNEFFAHLHERSLNIDLPDGVRRLPAMSEMRSLISRWGGLLNDIYSADREAESGYPFNAVLIVRRSRNCSLQEAVNVVNEVLTGMMVQFQASYAAVPSQVRAVTSDPRIASDVDRVVLGYQQMMRGNYDFHIGTPRYARLSET